MPESLSSIGTSQKNNLRSSAPFVWLFEIQLTSTTAVRVCSWDINIVHKLETYKAFPIDVGDQERSIEGRLPVTEVTISNLSREIVDQLESGNLINKELKVKLVHSNDPDNAIHESISKILDAVVTQESAAISIGQYELFEVPFPGVRYNRVRCEHTYGDPSTCGYDKTRVGALLTCSFIRSGINGCRAHGDDEEAAGLLRQHPQRFGGQPGIPRGKSRT